MTALICGSMAFDTVMVFPGRFKDHILADRIHMLNVAFLVPTMRRNFGGCAGNIAYNLQLLGGDGLPMAAVGLDFGPYDQWLAEQGIRRDLLTVKEGSYTAQAFITTDLDDNQITAFHPGAMNFAHEAAVPTDRGVKLGIVAPDGRDAMIGHAAQFAAAGIPFIFDPGQGLPMFDGEDLGRFIDQATWVTVNDYEGQLLQERTGLSAEAIAKRVRAYIVTRGAQGSLIYTDGRCLEIPTVPAAKLVDPTGCGDSYRAGLIHGLQRGLDWETTGRIASLLGSIKIAHAGTQGHRFTAPEFEERFHAAFGYRCA
jgi:adenosine kinase